MGWETPNKVAASTWVILRIVSSDLISSMSWVWSCMLADWSAGQPMEQEMLLEDLDMDSGRTERHPHSS